MKIRMKSLRGVALALSFGLALAAGAYPPTGPSAQAASGKQPPLTEKEVVQLVKKNKKDLQKIAPEIVQRGVAFEMKPEIEQELRKAGADDNFIANVKNQGPTARRSALPGSTTGAAGGVSVSPEEVQEFLAIQNELDADRQIQLVNEFEQKHPQSPYLSDAYFFAANAYYRQKRDVEQGVSYGEKSLKLVPDNLRSLVYTSAVLVDRNYLKAHENDKEKALARAEALCNHALEMTGKMQKRGNQTDEQLAQGKASIESMCYLSLGLVHEERALEGLTGPDPDELTKATESFNKSITIGSPPDPVAYFRLGETLSMLNKVDDAITAFSKASELWKGTALQAYADEKVTELKKKKEGSTPAKP